MKRPEIVAEARRYLGVPFRHQGRAMSGIDCAGLVEVVGIALGDPEVTKLAPKIRGYSRMPQEAEMQRLMAISLRRKPTGALQLGDIIQTIDHAGYRKVCHMGIVTGLNGGIGLIHAYNRVSYEKVVEHTFDPEWAAKISSVFEYHSVED